MIWMHQFELLPLPLFQNPETEQSKKHDPALQGNHPTGLCAC